MANKHKVTPPEVLQADGVTDDQTVTADAVVADDTPIVGVSGLPMEPEEERAARLQRELDDSRHKLLRLAAEFDNFRKRVAKERVELSDRAQAAFIMRLLDVLDDLERLVAGEVTAQQTGALTVHDSQTITPARSLCARVALLGPVPVAVRQQPRRVRRHELPAPVASVGLVRYGCVPPPLPNAGPPAGSVLLLHNNACSQNVVGGAP